LTFKAFITRNMHNRWNMRECEGKKLTSSLRRPRAFHFSAAD
jgi:hypothetical protein